MSAPLLRIAGLSKSFPGLRALDDVSLEVGPGQVLAVVGQNGSGKSTLVKVLAGVHEADPGATVEFRGADGHVLLGGAAQEELHFIHQDLGLIGSLSTVENLDLGRRLGRGGLRPIRTAHEAEHASALIARFGGDFDVRAPVGELSAAERTVVAIARALDGWTRPHKVLVLDEPTAALHGDEVGRLFLAVRRVAAEGAGVIFISHRLHEVVQLADRVVALRDGRVVADVAAGSFDHEALVRMITGREIPGAAAPRTQAAGASVMSVRGLAGGTVEDFDLELAAGEVVGVTGILGSGREYVAALLFGAQKRTAGTVQLAGEPLEPGRPHVSVRRRVAFVPADRKAHGAVMSLSVRENLTLPRLKPLRRFAGRIDRRAERRETAEWIKRVDLRPAAPEQAIGLYSGGNQQKVVLAKWLRNDPRVLLLDEPTQGVDIGAKASIYALIDGAVTAGAGVLVSTSDTKELVGMCDRVLVMRDGRIAAEVPKAALSERRLVRESLGLWGEEAEELFGDSQEGARV